jgi:hypothetical protein
LPCYDVKGITGKENRHSALLKFCTWKGIEVPCYSIFEKVTTDRGMCCAFNKPEADRIFLESGYTSIMKTLQNYDEEFSFEVEDTKFEKDPDMKAGKHYYGEQMWCEIPVPTLDGKKLNGRCF